MTLEALRADPCSAPWASIELWACSASGDHAALLSALAALANQLPLLQTLTLTMERAVLAFVPLLGFGRSARAKECEMRDFVQACGRLKGLRQLILTVHRCHASHIQEMLHGSFGKIDQLDMVVHTLDSPVDLVSGVMMPPAWPEMPPSVRFGGMSRQSMSPDCV
jgi:hypothetical protein